MFLGHKQQLYAWTYSPNTRWFKYDRDYLCVNKSQFVPVIFEPPCIIRVIKSRELRRAGDVWGRGEERRGVHRVAMGKPEGRKPFVRPRRRWDDIKMDLREARWGAWTGSIWLRIGTGGGLLRMRLWTFRLHKMRGICWLAYGVSTGQEGLCSVELVMFQG